MLLDWANQPFATLITTFIFAPYFAADRHRRPGPRPGALGHRHRRRRRRRRPPRPRSSAPSPTAPARRKRWVLAFSVPYVVGCLGFWLARPGDGRPDDRARRLRPRLPRLGVRHRLHQRHAAPPRRRAARSGASPGPAGRSATSAASSRWSSSCSSSPRGRTGRRRSSASRPILGLDPAAGEPARATGPLSALWYVVFALPFFLWTPDEPARPLAGALRAGLRDLAATFRVARRQPELLRLPHRLDGLPRRPRRPLHLRRHLRRRRPRLGPLPARRLRHRRRRRRHRRRLGGRPRRPRLRAAPGHRRLDLGS